MPQPDRTTFKLFQDTASGPRFLGTSFSFRHRRHLLTAAHCVKDVEHGELFAQKDVLGNDTQVRVQSVDIHPSADVALVQLDIAPVRPRPFHILALDYQPGLEVGAWGYPEEPEEGVGLVPTPRSAAAPSNACSRTRASSATRMLPGNSTSG